mgnify:CR=1 FL=1
MIDSLGVQIPFSEAAEGKTIRKLIMYTSGDTYILIAYTDGTFSYCRSTTDFDGTIIDDIYETEYLIHQLDEELLLQVFSKKLVKYLREQYEKEQAERLDKAERSEYANYIRLKAKFEGKA